ncbi:protein kinase [Vagococcus sp. PNs007]|uniref:Protein kinase n=1 Tax=Vagococcus proximus TaxID=2991417 RepID=A0ABT5X0L9_9ENTE|nr:RIO1 family regulatory kinase/ATPase [Vagococcus proximus]MDF0479548.1 protein kinase [Vagococcus proximus]
MKSHIENRLKFLKLLEKNELYKTDDTHWTYRVKKQPTQKRGFKIHLSASIINAYEIAKIFLDLYTDSNVDFKIVSNLSLLELQNSSMYGFTQIGKFITIYPESNSQFIMLLNDLELVFKNQGASPIIPSDYNYLNSSVVYYRYGEFVKDESFTDKRVRMIPENIVVPIKDYYIERLHTIPNKYLVIDIIKKTSKGGVYKVLNLENNRFAILREATHLSNILINGEDSVNRLYHANENIYSLAYTSLVPKIINEFYVNTTYFSEEEYLVGITLDEYIKVNKPYKWFVRVLDAIKTMHKKNILHGDISYKNILINDETLHFIDFEYSVNFENISDKNNQQVVGTPGFYDSKLNNSSPYFYKDIWSAVCLLFWSEDFKYFEMISSKTYVDLIKNYEELVMGRLISNFRNMKYGVIYEKTFNYRYNSIEEVKEDFNKIE